MKSATAGVRTRGALDRTRTSNTDRGIPRKDLKQSESRGIKVILAE